jgi:hypothetical protein
MQPQIFALQETVSNGAQYYLATSLLRLVWIRGESTVPKKTKICEHCNEVPAVHLRPMESGPTFGLTLADGSDDYCSHECWENAIQFERKLAEND